MRQEVGDQALLVGFTTYTGRVSAASEWDAEVEHKWVRPALHDSYEYLFRSTGLDRFFLRLDDPAAETLREPMLERAIGVLYLPHSERASHYFVASLPQKFDRPEERRVGKEGVSPWNSWVSPNHKKKK